MIDRHKVARELAELLFLTVANGILNKTQNEYIVKNIASKILEAWKEK